MGGPPSAALIRSEDEDYQVPEFSDPFVTQPRNQNNHSDVRSTNDQQQPPPNHVGTQVQRFATEDGGKKMGSLSEVDPRGKSYDTAGDIYVGSKPGSRSQIRPNGSTANDDVPPARNAKQAAKQAGQTLTSAELAAHYATRN